MRCTECEHASGTTGTRRREQQGAMGSDVTNNKDANTVY